MSSPDLRAANRSIRACIQIAWMNLTGSDGIDPFQDALSGLVSRLSLDGDVHQVARAVAALGLIDIRFGMPERDPPPSRAKAKTGRSVVRAFYASKEWRALSRQIRLRDGARCRCCGATSSDGARIVADHIKPIRKYWELRLDPDNIQILCNPCNLIKGSDDETRFC